MLENQRTGSALATKIIYMDTAAKRAKGLLAHSEVLPKTVAVFSLPLGGFFPLIHTIGMKFPIDILFCNKNKEVIYNYQNVVPFRFVFPWKKAFGGCSYLLEFMDCDLSSVELGDTLTWEEKS